MNKKNFPYSYFPVHIISKISQKIYNEEWIHFWETNSKLRNAVSTPVAASRGAFVERLQSVRESGYLLYNKIIANMGYGQKKLKDIVEKEAEGGQQRKPVATKEEEFFFFNVDNLTFIFDIWR